MDRTAELLPLILPDGAMRAMVAAARDAWPAEACGLLVGGPAPDGRAIRARRVIPAANLLAGTPDRFELDPAVRLAAEKSCRGGPDRVIGHWHSHPRGRAQPSATDLAMAFEPDLVWLILVAGSRAAPIAPMIGAFRPSPDASRFLPLPLLIHPGGECAAEG
jgi:proteasome lid subunit RPN8/RPN11